MDILNKCKKLGTCAFKSSIFLLYGDNKFHSIMLLMPGTSLLRVAAPTPQSSNVGQNGGNIPMPDEKKCPEGEVNYCTTANSILMDSCDSCL